MADLLSLAHERAPQVVRDLGLRCHGQPAVTVDFTVAPPVRSAAYPGKVPAVNYTDLWWNAAESGWGINVTHQDQILFATMRAELASAEATATAVPCSRHREGVTASG